MGISGTSGSRTKPGALPGRHPHPQHVAVERQPAHRGRVACGAVPRVARPVRAEVLPVVNVRVRDHPALHHAHAQPLEPRRHGARGGERVLVVLGVAERRVARAADHHVAAQHPVLHRAGDQQVGGKAVVRPQHVQRPDGAVHLVVAGRDHRLVGVDGEQRLIAVQRPGEDAPLALVGDDGAGLGLQRAARRLRDGPRGQNAAARQRHGQRGGQNGGSLDELHQRASGVSARRRAERERLRAPRPRPRPRRRAPGAWAR